MNKLLTLILILLVLGCVSQEEVNNNSNQNFSSNSQLLLWPIGCNVSRPCIGIIFPDIDKNSLDYNCQPWGYNGHEGTDIMPSSEDARIGVPVYAAADGQVLWVFDGKYDKCPNESEPDCQAPINKPSPGDSEGYRVCTEAGQYCRNSTGECFWCFYGGNVVVIRHYNNSLFFATRYDHLMNNSITVKPGDKVKQGDVIGMVGSAGHSSGPHLHFEVWGDYYTPIDPWNGPCGPNTGVIYWINRTGLKYNLLQYYLMN